MMAYQGKAARLIAARFPQAGKVVYGGTEPEGEALARSYRYWRARDVPSVQAVDKACLDSFRNERRWQESGLASYQNRPSDRGGRWIESPADVGLRFVGFSDELTGSRESGWHLSPDGDTGAVARGAVYQLPARDGRPVYVEGVRLCSGGKRGWQDQSRYDSAIVYLGEWHLGEPGGSEYKDEQAIGDAARGADLEAEILAERERDYQEAFMAGQRASELEAEAAELRERYELPTAPPPPSIHALRNRERDLWEAFTEGLGNAAVELANG